MAIDALYSVLQHLIPLSKMKVLIIFALVISALASIDAAQTPDASNLNEILHQLGLASKSEAVLERDTADEDEDDDGDYVAKAMSDALLSSLVDVDDDSDADDGEGSIMANIMAMNEEDAVAQFKWFKKMWKKVRKSPIIRRVGRLVGRHVRNRVCRG